MLASRPVAVAAFVTSSGGLVVGSEGCQSPSGSAFERARSIARHDPTILALLAPRASGPAGEKLGFSEGKGAFVSDGYLATRRGDTNAFAVMLPERADQATTLAPGGISTLQFRVGTSGARPVRGELHEGRLLYPDVLPDTDALVVTNTTSVETFYFLRSKEAQHSFTFQLTLPSAVTAVEPKTDGLWFYDRNHAFVMHMPAPYALDANGARVAASISWSDAERSITVALPKSPNALYPMLLDPAFETLTWSELRSPRGLGRPSMSYDEKRKTFVATTFNETWLNAGAGWNQYVAARGETPLGMANHRVQAYDRERDRTVLFGGTFGQANGDTWLWDGSRYERALPATSPPARFMSMMTYDAVRKEVVLFGGRGSTAVETGLNDTWVWNGVTWLRKFPQHVPPARSLATLAFDETRGKAVLFGGVGDINVRYDDTYTWDGNDWTQVVSANHPEARGEAVSAYDGVRQRVILFGGRRLLNNELLADTWSFDGSEWVQESPVVSAPALAGAAMAYDRAAKSILLVGGSARTTTGEGPQDDFWRWTGTAWQKDVAGNAPEKPQDVTLFPNQSTGELLLFMGREFDPAWAFAFGGWSRRDYRRTPSPRIGVALAADEKNQEVVLFGGAGETGPLADTWVASGSSNTFVRRRPGTSPTPRSGHHLAYDRLRQQVVLFGGRDASGYLSDTWTWDGMSWTKRQPANSPSPRALFGFALDQESGDVFLVGGEGNTGALGDMWRWNGSNWFQVPGVQIPKDQEAVLLSATPSVLVLSSGRQAEWDRGTSQWRPLAAGSPPWLHWPESRAATASTGTFVSGRAVLSTSGGTRTGQFPGGIWSFTSLLSDAYGAIVSRPWNNTDPLLAFAGSVNVGSFAEAPYFMPATFDRWEVEPDPYHYPNTKVAATYDPVRRVPLIVAPGNEGMRTYTWDGTEMIELPTQPTIPSSDGSSLAFDIKRGSAVLVMDEGSSTLATYTLAGDAWTRQGDTVGQSPRRWSAMAYDEARQNIVLFGGDGRGSPLRDTWIWDGASWKEARPKSQPAARWGHTLAYDPTRKTVLMFGGFGAEPLKDTWEWNGSDWIELRPRVTPPARGLHGFAIDPASKRALLFAGRTSTNGFNSTWFLDSRGGGCTATTDCVSGACVDGVCCEATTCGACETCAGTDPGKCTKVTNAPDPDSCPASNKTSCDAAGVCRPGLGSTCKDVSDCSSGFCVDGICCDTACDRACESCVASEKQSSKDDGVCGPSRAKSNPGGRCAGDATCNFRGVCETTSGESCIAGRYSEDVSGKRRDCAPYRCASSCLTICSSSSDCVFPATCSPDGKCVAPAESPSDDGGCTVHATGKGRTHALLPEVATLTALLAVLWGRKRKRPVL